MVKKAVAKADITWTGNKVLGRQGDVIDDPKVAAQLLLYNKELVEEIEVPEGEKVVEKVKKKKKK